MWRRFDYVRGYSGEHVARYLEEASGQLSVGEYWDSLKYRGSVPEFDQVLITTINPQEITPPIRVI